MKNKKVVSSGFYEKRKVSGKIVKVVICQLTKEEARQAFPYRPHSKYSESRFGGNSFCDDVCILRNFYAKRCRMCHAATRNEYLDKGTCPDCDGRSESDGVDPHGIE